MRRNRFSGALHSYTKALFLKLFRSYRGKWLLAVFSICFMMFLLLVGDKIVLARQFLYQREMQRINEDGMLLTNFIGDNLMENDTNDVKRIIAASVEQSDIRMVTVLDTHKTVRYSSMEHLQGKPSPFIDSGMDALKTDIYYKTFPIIYENRNFGFMQVGYSLEKIQYNLKLSFVRLLALELLIFSIILLFAWRITESLLRPLAEMKDVSNIIANGNFSVRAKVTTHDIIGELADALNHMARQLGDLTDNMKIRILEATNDLTEVNNELTQKTVELQRSNERLMELDQLKSDFVSMVSHELKTPLTSIIGFSKTLLSLELPQQQRTKYLKIIETEGKRLAQLIEQYLDISKIEAGKFTVRSETVDIIALVRDLVEQQKIRSDHELIFSAPVSVAPITGDGDQLRRVLINIFDNACKYSPIGAAVDVTIEEGPDDIVVSVKDRGPGIAAENLHKIFDKFYRAPDDPAQKTRGSGLGLAISKGIIDSHKGALWVESESGKGATFCFSLPKNKGSGAA